MTIRTVEGANQPDGGLVDVAGSVHKRVANERDESTEISKNIEALVQAVELRNPSRLRAGLWCCFLLNGVLGDD